MKDTLKSVGSFILGICVLVGVMFLVTMLVKGGVWLSERVYPWLVIFTAIALFIVIFALLPLAIFRRTRAFAGGSIYISSFVFGLTVWVWSLLISYTLWGIGGIVVGLLLGGIGVVPIAILASLFHGLWPIVGQLLLVTAFTFGTRFFGIYVMMKSEDRDHTANNARHTTTMNDDALYEEVARELQAKAMVPGVWTRAFAEAGGNLDHQRAYYIKHRVAQLAEIRSHRLAEERRAVVAAKKQRALSGFRQFSYKLLAIVFLILTVVFGICIIISLMFLFVHFSAGAMIFTIFMCTIAFVFGLAAYSCVKVAQK